VDERSEKLGAKIRDGELEKIPVLLVVGAREAESAAASVRLRHRGDLGTKTLDEIVATMTETVRKRLLSPWPEGA
jgi:threonyl-tRNA synthetase